MNSPANCHRNLSATSLLQSTPAGLTFLMKLTPLSFLGGKYTIFLISFKPNLKMGFGKMNKRITEAEATPTMFNKESLKGGYLIQMIEDFMSIDSKEF